eukprot:1366109-Prymnesium_polylepis.1
MTLWTKRSDRERESPIWMARSRSMRRGSRPLSSDVIISRAGSHCTRPLLPPPPCLQAHAASSSATAECGSFSFRMRF